MKITIKNKRYSAMMGGFHEEPQELEVDVLHENNKTAVVRPVGWDKVLTVKKSRLYE